MPVQRMTARKVRISELMSGRWEKKEGMEPSFVVTPAGERVSRARVLGTVMSKFIAEDGNFASLTLDDSTGVMRAKTFKTTKPVDGFEAGDLVDVVGKVREWNGEIYMIPEVIARVGNPNLELLRRLELMKKAKTSEVAVEPPPEMGMEKDSLKKKVLALLGKKTEGMAYGELVETLEVPEGTLDSVVTELLEEGICYEPIPGKIRKI